ncbi:hypothetical protein ACFL3V_01860 [Nanoarchaeota archaeon]
MNRVAWVILLFLLIGCAPKASFDVSLLNFSQTAVYDWETNQSTDVISFLIRNDDKMKLDCDIILGFYHGNEEELKKAKVGLIEPGNLKNISIDLDMLDGDADMNITTECSRYTP